MSAPLSCLMQDVMNIPYSMLMATKSSPFPHKSSYPTLAIGAYHMADIGAPVRRITVVPTKSPVAPGETIPTESPQPQQPKPMPLPQLEPACPQQLGECHYHSVVRA